MRAADWSQRALLNMSADIAFTLFDRKQITQRDERDTNVRTLRGGVREQRELREKGSPVRTSVRTT